MQKIPEMAVGIPHAGVAFRATLTATTNRYLADRLPVEGLVLIGERSLNGDCIRVLFMPDPAEGEFGSFVAVPEAKFEFSSLV